MLTVVTGLPGAGKTLNTLVEVHEKHSGQRPIYYHGIQELTLKGWTQLDDPQSWPDLPAGSVVVIDEAQGHWPARGNKGDKPRSVQAVETHRHHGFDLYFITQNAKLIDHNLRRLAGRHLHFWRPFGIQKTARWEWQEVVDPSDYFAKKNAVSKKMVKFPRKYFGCYASAEVHTHKRRLPKKLLMIPGLICLLGLTGYAGYYALTSITEPDGPSLSEIHDRARTFPKLPRSLSAEPQNGRIVGSLVGSFQTVYLIQRDSDLATRRIDGQKCHIEKGNPVCVVNGARFVANQWMRDRGQTEYLDTHIDELGDIQGQPID